MVNVMRPHMPEEDKGKRPRINHGAHEAHGEKPFHKKSSVRSVRSVVDLKLWCLASAGGGRLRRHAGGRSPEERTAALPCGVRGVSAFRRRTQSAKPRRLDRTGPSAH